ncbi:nucleotidyltransferase family protein [Vallitalea pronyensis]|uniref:Nucleotidyltransferase family protein n=1 Tax=Vallitalea pronyensis TaxID=1348613 RepID=A0A8J8MLT9_9FIRM|nr:nucleotidyltransferase family protein [Vallitalea pronyensis]QUI23839.1 nucleotidyltransferase family protein [Vallitalea pronyensis]
MINFEMTNEEKIVILGSRITFSQKNKDSLRELCIKDIDWYNVFNIAIKNKVATLVWYNLMKLKLENKIPHKLERIIYFYYIGTKKRNKAYINDMKKILSILQENNIYSAPLKGGYLIPNMYKDYGIRTISDVDCLVKRSDVSRIISIMESLNYTQGDYDYQSNSIQPIDREKQILWKMNMNNLYPFKKISKSEYFKFIEVDFCFSLDLNLDLSPVEVMISEIQEDNDFGLYTLKPSHFFVHLCCHLFKEATNTMWIVLENDLNLIKFCDVREYMLNNMDEDMKKEAIEFAKDNHLEKAIYFTIYYLKEIYNDGYEDELIEQLEISNDSFINMYGERDYGEGVEWSKSFWHRIFDNSNKDELKKGVRYLELD